MLLFPCAFGLTALALLLQWTPPMAEATGSGSSTAVPLKSSSAAPAAATTTAAPAPILQTTNGQVKGTYFPLDLINPALGDGIVEWFFGIPYAQPPVGNLRLEKPVPSQNWTSPLDGTNAYSALPCYNQHSPDPSLGLSWTEDCLKLNLYRPAGTQPHAGLPILVYIHTGGWGVGGLLVEGPFGFTALYAANGIITIHIAYRLTLLGFFSDGTSSLPGNLGLWDQRLALQWIHSNAANIGGDPNRITIWGESAGGASVAFHSVTPGSYNFFSQAIQQSGSWNSPWAISPKTVNSSLNDAKALGCSAGPNLKSCLKNVSINAIQAQLNTHPYAATDFDFVLYMPREDGDFFPADFQTLAQKAPKKPTLIGFNSDESIILTTSFPDPAFNVVSAWTVANATSFCKQDLINFINQNIVVTPLLPSSPVVNAIVATLVQPQIQQIRSQLINFYANANNTENVPSNVYYFRQYTRLFTDIQFITPVQWEARLKSQLNWTTFLYHFDHINSALASTIPYPAPQHTGEYPYDIGVNLFGNVTLDSNDLIVQQTLVGGIVNFVFTGNPNGVSSGNRTPAWPQLHYSGNSCSGSSQYTAININTSSHVEGASADVVPRLAFWDSLANNYNLNIVKSFPGTQTQCLGGLLGAILNALLNGLG